MVSPALPFFFFTLALTPVVWGRAPGEAKESKVFGNGDVGALAMMDPTFGWKNAHLRRTKKKSLSHGSRLMSILMSASFPTTKTCTADL